MNHASFLVLCEAARLELMIRSGFFKVAKSRRWYLPTAGIYAQYQRPVRRSQKVEVLTKLAAWNDDGGWIEQRVLVDGKLAALVAARGVIREGRRSIPVVELREKLWPDFVAPELNGWIADLARADALARGEAENLAQATQENAATGA